ncbi:hypothetical protein EVAR_82251_1 [Eumeta japonica]|uniref:DDE-1 domain-containing protein n=1 Tax=Eumeta variegata TaxID=151549 RepID=A0A4C1VZY9_EUMVA|nr:hypothetical protein EVAR_82251_1 [Eumeta japonica]
MRADVFNQFITEIFAPYLAENNIKKPVILFIDGHKSHITLQLRLTCKELGVELVALYPNTTRITQPADVSVFGPIKKMYQKTVRKFQSENVGEVACGLCPFDENAIDYSKCLDSPRRVEETDRQTADYDENKIMSLKEFENIVGLAMIDKMKRLKSEERNKELEFVNATAFLGITLDNRLQWSPHMRSYLYSDFLPGQSHRILKGKGGSISGTGSPRLNRGDEDRHLLCLVLQKDEKYRKKSALVLNVCGIMNDQYDYVRELIKDRLAQITTLLPPITTALIRLIVCSVFSVLSYIWKKFMIEWKGMIYEKPYTYTMSSGVHRLQCLHQNKWGLGISLIGLTSERVSDRNV